MFKSVTKKILSMIFSLIVITTLIVSCGDGAEDTTTLTTTTTEPPTTTTATSTTPTVTISYEGLSLVTFDSGDFAGSGNCAVCHTALEDEAGNDVSIDSDWRSSMMANAAKDPYWQAKVFAEVFENPELQEIIEDTCATCHMPMARTQAQVDGTSSLMLDGGFLSEGNTLHDAAMDGNSCTLCHQIQPDGLGTEDSFAGQYGIDTSTNAPNRIAFGQFDNQMINQMQALSGFIPEMGEQVTQAVLCATCHTVITPFVDEDGNVQGTFPEQASFLEWRNSDYSDDTPCQSCHMPVAEGDVAIANMPSNLDALSPFHQHFFVGGNSLMLDIIKTNGEEIGVSASSDNFDDTVELTLNQLQDNTADVQISSINWNDNQLEITVDVSNYAGHKYPTGFPSRRSWIHLTVTDKDGNIVFESGKTNADGTISGNNADADVDSFEPHYDVITGQEQVQIYESVMQTYEGDVTYTLLRAASYIKDNRILPDGFNKDTDENRIAVVGGADADTNFIGGSDQVTYIIDAAGDYQQLNVEVELLYQSISFNFAQAVFKVAGELTEIFEEYFLAADITPVLVAYTSSSVE